MKDFSLDASAEYIGSNASSYSHVLYMKTMGVDCFRLARAESIAAISVIDNSPAFSLQEYQI